MDAVTIAVPIGWLATLGIWIMPPRIRFGSPVQRGKAAGESFWHIPIEICPWLFGHIGPAKISPCQIYLDRFVGGQIADKIRLGWGDMHFEEPRLEEMLKSGRPLLVPIAWRSEAGDDRNAYWADLNFVRKSREYNRSIPADRQKNKFRLRVKFGRWRRSSPHFYMVRVPSNQSNGHFSVEIEYEGEGTQGV